MAWKTPDDRLVATAVPAPPIIRAAAAIAIQPSLVALRRWLAEASRTRPLTVVSSSTRSSSVGGSTLILDRCLPKPSAARGRALFDRTDARPQQPRHFLVGAPLHQTQLAHLPVNGVQRC